MLMYGPRGVGINGAIVVVDGIYNPTSVRLLV